MLIYEVAERYNSIQKKMGVSEKSSWINDIDDLFTEDFTKVINGQTIVNNRASLSNQILSCIETAGSWVIEEKDIIPSSCNQKCTIRYIIKTQKGGSFDVIAILSSDKNNKILKIDEICYQIEN